MEFYLGNTLTNLEEQSDTIPIPDLFISESDHMPLGISPHCLKAYDFYVFFRREAVSLILQEQYSYNYNPFISYLAVNYMDRFFSRKDIPQGKPWILRLVVISCLSLAAKMKNTHFSFSNIFQGEEGFLFDTRTIHRMELQILDALNWRMRSITPFSFLHFFISLFDLKDPPSTQALKDRAREIIFKAQNEIKLLEFKPSMIAASALLVASHELFPMQFSSFKCSLSSCEFVNKEKVLNCYNALQEMVEIDLYESTFDNMSCTRTPSTVLDRHCSKSESETSSINTTPTTTMANGSSLPEIKRRRLNCYSK